LRVEGSRPARSGVARRRRPPGPAPRERSPVMPRPLDVAAVQEALAAFKLDGWLFYDFHHSDPLGYRILGLPEDRMATRGWFYFIPARGEPSKITHRIEPDMLEPAIGARLPYSVLHELNQRLDAILKGARRVAMQYSPENAIPY